MKASTFFKKASLAVSGLVAGLLLSTAVVGAIPYDGAQTNASPVPAFNVFTGVPSYGDESDFLRARVPANGNLHDGSTPYTDPIATTCTDKQFLQLRVYVHNGASKDGNNNGAGPSVIHGAKVKVTLPTDEATSFTPSATLSASNAATVNDSATINCNGQKVKLHYVAGSASQFSDGTNTASALDDSIVTTGAPIQSQATPGDVWGCWEQRVYVILTVQVEVAPPTLPVTATCDLFKIETADDRTVKVSAFKYTATNATYKNTVINWDAGKTNDSTAAITDATKVVGQTHQYSADGTYLITATVHFSTADNADLAASTENCQQQVVFTTKKPPVVTTTTTETPATPVVAKPTALVNTGAGSVMALFGATTVLAATAYRWFLGRRLEA
ncbi:MAG: hypothetical protein QFB87_01995 [Patescibacteria group bacterium]|nr:hypothetical protein [Patescibacteria group bacterium]